MRIRYLGLLVLLIATLAAPARAAVVFDNTAEQIFGKYLPSGFLPFSAYVPNEPTGELIRLGGNERAVTKFEVVLSSSQRTTVESMSLKFYLPTGLDYWGNPGAPAAEPFYSTSAESFVVDGLTTIVFDIPHVDVPDEFIWIVAADSDYAGLATYGPPTVGTSVDGWWDYDLTARAWFHLDLLQNPVVDFGTRVTAVPEPVIMPAVLLAIMALRRSRRGRVVGLSKS